MLDPQLRRGPVDSAAVYTHSRTRTTSSNIFPPAFPVQGPIPVHPGQALPQQNMQYSRRSPSVNTFSTSSTVPPPAAYRTSPTTEIRRSTSSRSGGASPQPLSYVAALRRQKGTVWCDRAQPEDPALAAQMRAAKAKASRAMLGTPRLSGGYGGSAGGRTSTGISATGKVAAKIRHHGKPLVAGYASGENHVGVGGVPPRLSATEVEGESSGDDDSYNKLHHRRTGSSGRNSIASGGRRNLAYRTSGGLGSQKNRSPSDTPERSGSLAEDRREGTPTATIAPSGAGPSDAASAKSQSTGTSAERADNVADLDADLALASKSRQHSALTREKSTKNPTDLARRGSVDERTMTMSAGRLYIANPD
ncbi:hypothetical protein jhhlp_004432 [Lomentospora prolificans]|uniref:Uncharacterized protein n=1 Tax=Lomentospora prolificans TaxID=41688 RepID=A0A2N3NBK1_9PEZI|nr:hypothetical protein jhhlp_004432 [Lomentospora prolificans]